MAQPLSTKTSELSLFDWALAQQAAKAAAQKEYDDANNALSKADTELHEANCSGNMRRMTREAERYTTAQARFHCAKQALRQFN